MKLSKNLDSKMSTPYRRLTVTMSAERLCEPCRRLLRGENENGQPATTSSLHQPSTASFRQALQLPCYLCSYAWQAARGRSTFDSHHSPEKTYYIIRKAEGLCSEYGPDARNLYFGSDENPFHTNLVIIPSERMSGYHYPQLLSHNTGSDSVVRFLLDKYKECREKHSECNVLRSSMQYYPSRLIDVGVQGERCIRLRETLAFGDEGPYFTLSHCWGGTQPYKLTKWTAKELESGLSLTSLPKTFQDAISVTRSFGVRFLWIDSLCIFQDDSGDWSTQASRMKDVYSRAECTIAATAARDSAEGLFFDRDPESVRPRHIHTTWSATPEDDVKYGNLSYPQSGAYWLDHAALWTTCVESAPLNKRAWVAQERHLSPRIMHFSKSQLFWECHTVKASENYPTALPSWALPHWSNNPGELKEALHSLKLEQLQRSDRASVESKIPQALATSCSLEAFRVRDLYFSWLTFRITYSSCALTKEGDKLVAINGIAQHFGEAMGDQLVAGLWKGRLLEELCWFKQDRLKPKLPEPTIWRAPTWSWASTDDMVWVSNITMHHNCLSRQLLAEVHSIDVDTDSSGALTRASMSVRCKPLQSTVSRLDTMLNSEEISGSHSMAVSLEKTNTDLFWRSRDSPFDGVELNLDDGDDERTRHVTMFIIQRCLHEDSDEDEPYMSDCAEGLLLEGVPGSLDTFKRIGTFDVAGKRSIEKMNREHEAADTRIITLI